MSFTTLGIPWNGIKDAIKNLRTTGSQTVTVQYSFIIAGTMARDNEAGGSSTCVTLQNYNGSQTVNHTQFTTEITNSLAEWKSTFESLFPGLTVTFVDNGDETTTAVPSDGLFGNYALPNNQIGDMRFGMHNIDGASNILGHGYSPGGVLGSVGNVGGDTHFDSQENWRLDAVTPASAPNTFSIKYVTVHEIGHNLGIGHDSNPNSVMYAFASTSDDFGSQFPSGLDNSTPDRNALDRIYNIDPRVVGVNIRNKIWERVGTTGGTPRGLGWTRKNGDLAQVAINSLGAVYGVNSTGRIFYQNGNTLQAIPSGRLMHIAVSTAGIWGVNRRERIWYRSGIDSNPLGVGWNRLPGRLVRVTTNSDGTLWGVNNRGFIYFRVGITSGRPTGLSWARITGPNADEITLGRNGVVWILSNSTDLRYRGGVTGGTPQGTSWVSVSNSLSLQSIAASPSGMLYAVGNDCKVYVREGITLSSIAGTHWRQVSGRLMNIAAGWEV